MPPCNSHDASPLDSVEQRYGQHAAAVDAFPVVQIGLSCFRWNDGAGRFEVQTFQFLIFARGRSSLSSSERKNALPDRRFLLQAMCLTYIRAHGFDLNEWVDDGISYLSHADQEDAAIREWLARPLEPDDVVARFAADDATPLRLKENAAFIDDMRALIEAKLLSDSTEDDDDSPTLEDNTRFLQAPCDDQSEGFPAITTAALPPFRRFALMHLVKNEFADRVLVFDCSVDNHDNRDVKAAPWKRCLRVVRVKTDRHRSQLLDAHAELVRREVRIPYLAVDCDWTDVTCFTQMRDRNLESIGFSVVMDLVVAAKRPIVGHNMLLDMMHCFSKFYKPLPSTCAEFLHKLHAWLDGATLFDTKVMVEYARKHLDAFSDRLEHTALEHVYEITRRHPFYGPQVLHSVHPDGDNAAIQTLQAHQAGYDAFMTGAVFLRVCSALGVPNEAISTMTNRLDTMSEDDYRPRWRDTMALFTNAMLMTNLLPTVTLQLPGPFPHTVATPSRAHIVRLKLTRTFKPRLQMEHIQRCIAWALGLRSARDVRVYRVGSDVAFASLSTPEQADQLLSIAKETPPELGTARDPMPSIACADLSVCEANESRSHVNVEVERGGAADRPTDNPGHEISSHQAPVQRDDTHCGAVADTDRGELLGSDRRVAALRERASESERQKKTQRVA
ncbi:hypothetical protein PINS_up005864 [Pythium insidiosum]|nr:hypothetical protein PINS_up005864 [Pythium insidiosum]